MYRKHFGLNELPFRNTPDNEFFYSAADRKEIIDALEYVIGRRDAIVKVTGEVGSGKTTILRMLAESLKNKGFKVVYVPTPRLSAEEILRFIAKDLGLHITGQESKVDLYDEIYKYLLEAYSQSSGVVVLIDEAHTIPLDTLEEIRLLSNIETGKEKLLTIVLFGQPELDSMLDKPEARQLKSRISHEFYLRPFTAQQVHDYLNFRMFKAGYSGEQVFDKKAAKSIFEKSKGLPRVINNYADKLLLSVYSRGGRAINDKDLKAVGLHDAFRWKVFYVLLLMTVVILGSIYAIKYNDAHYNMGDSFGLFGERKGHDIGEEKKSAFSSEKVGSKKVGIASDTSEEPLEDKGRRKSSLVPWEDNKFAVALLTITCDKPPSFFSEKRERDLGKKVLILKFLREEGNVYLCTFVAGAFRNMKEAEYYVDSLPKYLKNNKPYLIRVKKLNEFIKERKAVVYES